MKVDRLRLAGLGLLVAGVLLVSVVAGTLSTSPEPNPDALVDEALESVETEPIEGVRVETIQRPGWEEQVTVAVKREPPHQSRTEVIGPSGEANQGEITVINRSTVWRYMADQKRAVQYENGQFWFDNSPGTGTEFQEVLDVYESDYGGTEQVDGRETHVVELYPPDDTTVSLSLDINAGSSEYEIPLTGTSDKTWYISKETWWIDSNTTYPVKQRIEWTDQNGDVVATTIREYEELTVGPEIDDDAFRFNPYTDAEVDEVSVAESKEFETREGATAAVPFEIPRPDVPESYQLEHITAQTYGNEHVMLWAADRRESLLIQTIEGDEHTVLLNYHDGQNSVTVAVSERAPPAVSGPLVERDLGEFDGDLVVQENRAAIVRDCGDLTYRVSGLPNIDKLAEIAGSMDCQ